MLLDEKIALNDTPFTKEWFKFEGWSCIYTGQVKDGRPNGFVRVLWEFGHIYEGFHNKNVDRNGFVRGILPNGDTEIGWYEKDKAHGNLFNIKPDGTTTDGWYEDKFKKGP